MEIHFAPMQGYTELTYRMLHAAICGGVDMYYTPFVRLERGEPRRRDLQQLAESKRAGERVTPQIIFRSYDEFVRLAEVVKGMGFSAIDLNLGCPYPMQTRKGRGAAMIANEATMRRVANYIAADGGASYSIKMRLGDERHDEWHILMPILNDLKLSHITVHPRISRQLYAGPIDSEQLHAICEVSTNSVIVNGDIATPEDIYRVASEYPEAKGVMIGRGLLARPTLALEWRRGLTIDLEECRAKVLEIHDEMLRRYRDSLCGDTQILLKIKPYWDYLEPIIGRKVSKAIRKAGTLDKYLTALEPVQ